MTQFTPAMDAALRADVVTPFGALAIDVPTYGAVNLLDGAGALAFGGRSFAGIDPLFGVLSTVQALTDGAGDQAPALTVELIPAGGAAAATLAAPTMQGAPVSLWVGAIDRTTGQPIPDPLLVFLGELDVPTLQSTGDGRTLSLEVVSVFERLFEDDESARLSPGFHQSIFANELGLAFVTGVDQPVFWGVAADPSGVVSGAGGGGDGGGSIGPRQLVQLQ